MYPFCSITSSEAEGVNLREVTVGELESLYCRRYITGIESPLLAPEPMTQLRRQIIDELSRRNPSDDSERLKIAYCLDVYRNDLQYRHQLEAAEC